MVVVHELKSEEEWRKAYSVMHQLRTHLDLKTYLELVAYACRHGGYRLFALYEGEKLVSVAGLMPMTTLYYGKFIWIGDLVTDERMRSKGYGSRLLDFIHTWAAGQGYSIVALSSGLQRKEAHRFYREKMGYDPVSYVFKNELG
ncbi:GNAT family N-acetyltransferase [Sporolactobacillus sp. CQH2019]|uniref:GNAT family N-acetyltransferase n=1 Tax=Sporolactobacillus sp. CQH2019 TaxID=3023512 RepID=UPI0023682238|nr:GNAT family N-acetyltransferase [Sporolactobacillus sp. CQH2019]MDD9149092.1 GNAT family N-acetyltransferase [Sporolactobacillus sp. CQH2019]